MGLNLQVPTRMAIQTCACVYVCVRTYSSDRLSSSHHVCQSSVDDVILQVLQHGLHPTGNLVHQREHQVQLWRGKH